MYTTKAAVILKLETNPGLTQIQTWKNERLKLDQFTLVLSTSVSLYTGRVHHGYLV